MAALCALSFIWTQFIGQRCRLVVCLLRARTRPGLVAQRRPRVSVMVRLVYAVARALMCSTVSLAAPADANSDYLPCGVLNETRGSLDDDISAGIDGVLTVISSPYAVGSVQKRDAEVRLAM